MARREAKECLLCWRAQTSAQGFPSSTPQGKVEEKIVSSEFRIGLFVSTALARPTYIGIPDPWQLSLLTGSLLSTDKRDVTDVSPWHITVLVCCWDMHMPDIPPTALCLAGKTGEDPADLLHGDIYSVCQIYAMEDGDTCISFRKKEVVCSCVISYRSWCHVASVSQQEVGLSPIESC